MLSFDELFFVRNMKFENRECPCIKIFITSQEVFESVLSYVTIPISEKFQIRCNYLVMLPEN